MQITLDIKQMSAAEREHLAGFIITYPSSSNIKVGISVQTQPTISDDDLNKALSILEKPTAVYGERPHTAGVTTGITGAPIDGEMQLLQHEHESTLPDAAFGTPVVDAATQAFGAPLVPPATTAPVGADAGQLTTAHVVVPPPPATVLSVPTVDQVVTAPTGAPPSNLADLDKHGFPWDHRIHSESKTKVADGSWRKKRGCDPVLVAEVEAQLKQVMPTGAPLAEVFAPAFIPTTPVGNDVIPFDNQTAVPAPPAPVSTTPPPPASVNVEAAKSEYVALVGRVSAALSSKRVTIEGVTAVCAAHGIPALPLLVNRLDLVPQVAAEIDAIIVSPQA